MAQLKKFKEGDEIMARGRWKSPFIVEVIYRGYIVAVNRRFPNSPQFLFIYPYKHIVYHGSYRYLKYGVNSKTSIREFIDEVIKGNQHFDTEVGVPEELILSEEAFIRNERREQIRCVDDVEDI